MTDSSLSGRLAHFLSSAFLALALLMAVGVATYGVGAAEVGATTSSVSTSSEPCSNTVGDNLCEGQPLDCLCEVIVTPGNPLPHDTEPILPHLTY